MFLSCTFSLKSSFSFLLKVSMEVSPFGLSDGKCAPSRSRSLFPLDKDLSTLEKDPTSRTCLRELLLRQQFFTFDDAGCRLLPLAAACCRKPETQKGLRAYFSLLREEWGSQLSHFFRISVLGCGNCGEVVAVGVEAVTPRRDVDRRVLTAIQVFGS